jgi:hypothetical protein
LVAILLTGWQAYRIAYRALEDAAYERLTAIRETKKRQIEAYFRSLVQIVETLAKGEVVTDAMLGFEAAAADPDGSDFVAVESLYRQTLAGYASTFGFDDLLFFDARGTRAVYSLQGELPAAESPENGNLSDVVTRALASEGATVIGDFAPYPQPDDAVAAFAAAAIYEDGVLLGAFAVRLSANEIDEVMTGGGSWREEGLGESGETYLVGSDGLMRSFCRLYLYDQVV